MPRRKTEDANETAFRVMHGSPKAAEPVMEPTSAEVSKVMAALGRKGGKIGGRNRAAALSQEQRSKIASQAARKRWAIT